MDNTSKLRVLQPPRPGQIFLHPRQEQEGPRRQGQPFRYCSRSLSVSHKGNITTNSYISTERRHPERGYRGKAPASLMRNRAYSFWSAQRVELLSIPALRGGRLHGRNLLVAFLGVS